MKFVLIPLVCLAIWLIAQKFLNNGKAKENIQLGETFLSENSKADGVQITASGLQYKTTSIKL